MNFTKKSVLCLGLLAGMLQSCTLDEPKIGGDDPANGGSFKLESITSGYYTVLKVEYDNSGRPATIYNGDAEEKWTIEYNPLRFVCTEYDDYGKDYPTCISVYDDILFTGSYISSMRITETDYHYNYEYDYSTGRDNIVLVNKTEDEPYYAKMTYDDGGHLLKIDSDGIITYTWDGAGNLVTINSSDPEDDGPYDLEYSSIPNTYGVWLPIWPGTHMFHMLGYLGVAPKSLPVKISDGYYDTMYFAYKLNKNKFVEAVKVTGDDMEGTFNIYYF